MIIEEVKDLEDCMIDFRMSGLNPSKLISFKNKKKSNRLLYIRKKLLYPGSKNSLSSDSRQKFGYNNNQ